MKRRLALLSLMALAMLLLSVLASVALASSSKPKLTLKAASSSVSVGSSLKLSVTVVSSTAPYEVRILKKTSSGWVRVATATLVAEGKYTAYVTFTSKGKRTLKAAYVNASGAIKAYSNLVTVTVK
jgi:hypothetical protein